MIGVLVAATLRIDQPAVERELYCGSRRYCPSPFCMPIQLRHDDCSEVGAILERPTLSFRCLTCDLLSVLLRAIWQPRTY